MAYCNVWDQWSASKGEESKSNFKGAICFSSLFRFLSDTKINDLNVKLYIGKDFSSGHSLEFTKEEIAYVFKHLSPIVDPPTILDGKYLDKDCVILHFDFTRKTIGYIKVVLTICRYFYETEYLNRNHWNSKTDIIRSMVHVMRDAIDFHKSNPDFSFIEVLQLMHYNVSDNSNHGLVAFLDGGYPTQIVSEETFKRNMTDKNFVTVYYHNDGIFNGCKIDNNELSYKDPKGENDKYLQIINTIKKI